MAISARSATGTSNVSTTGSTTLAVTVPTGTANGDLLLVVTGIGNASPGTTTTITAPTTTPSNPWTGLTRGVDTGDTNGGADIQFFWKKFATGDPTSYTFTLGASLKWAIACMAYVGTDPTTPIHVENAVGEVNAASTSHTTPTITTTIANCWIVSGFAQRTKNVTWTPPTGDTERIEQGNSGTSPCGSVTINDTAAAVAAGSYSKTSVDSTSTSVAAMAIIAIAPPTGTNGTVTAVTATATAAALAPTVSGVRSPTVTAVTATATATALAPHVFGQTAPNLTLPLRGAFYYPWFTTGDATYPGAWTQVTNPWTQFHPKRGYYNSATTSVIDGHIADMRYGLFDFGIISWWGQGSKEDNLVSTLLSRAATLGTGHQWCVYYEPEGNTVAGVTGSPNPSSATIAADLDYISANYTSHPNYLHIGGKPVIFVYGDATDDSASTPLIGNRLAARWNQAKTLAAQGWFVVGKVYDVWVSDNATFPLDGWHQYGPATAVDVQGSFSRTLSPRFWRGDETTPRLAELSRATWQQNIRDMVAGAQDFKLVTSFNEWGEGHAVEDCDRPSSSDSGTNTARTYAGTGWDSVSGFGTFLDDLHTNGAGGSTVTAVTATATAAALVPTVTAARSATVTAVTATATAAALAPTVTGGTSLNGTVTAVTATATARALAPRVTSAAPFGEWLFDAGSGTTAVDSSGNGHTLTATAASTAWTTPGHGGSAAAAVASWSGVAGTTTDPPAMSVMFWLKVNTAPATFGEIIHSEDLSVQVWNDLTVFCDMNEPPVESVTAYSAKTTDTVPLGSWIHVCFTCNSASPGTGIIYLNGVASVTKTGFPVDATASFEAVDLLKGDYQTALDCAVDDLRLFDTAISAANVVAYMGGTPDATVVAVAATATGAALAPTVSGVRSPTVTAVTATATGAALAPTVSSSATVTATTATATGAALAPTVSGVRSPTVTAVAATATGLALPPTLSSSSTVTAVTATATGAALAPTVGGGATVTATTATATGAALAPTVSGVRSPTVTAVAATATGAALPPTLSTGATVTAVPASATAAALAPTVSSSPTVTAVPATATAAATAPTLSSSPTVTAVPATATAAALTPTVSGVRSPTVTAVPATATAAALVPTATGSGASTVSAATATATAAALPPTVTAARSATVTAVAASATAAAPAPLVSGSSTVTATPATATAAALPPTVTGTRNATIAALVALATAEALTPLLSAGVTVTATTATATGAALPPTVSGARSVTVVATIALATAHALAPTVTGVPFRDITLVIGDMTGGWVATGPATGWLNDTTQGELWTATGATAGWSTAPPTG